MDIQHAGSSVPLNEVPTESFTPEGPSLPPTISQPFQDDGIVSYQPPGLDLGDSQTTPAGTQMGGTLADPERWQGGFAQQAKDAKDRLIDNVLESKRDTAEDILDDIR